MFLRILNYLRESSFIEGMARILDWRGVLSLNTKPVKDDADALNDDWNKVFGDYKHSIVILKEKRNGTR